MHNSTKIADSPDPQKFGLHSTPNYSRDATGQTLTTPKMTASPIRLDMYATPPKPHILSPRRYSLSDIVTSPRITKRDSINRSSFQHNLSGPLLASMKFNVNVSTYEETKSPGMARRIVHYNQEAENLKDRIHPPTHQAKYGSPGLFPIVHLFKTSPPTLEQRPKRVKVRISSPGYTRQQSEDYKLKLLEGIVRPRSLTRFNQGYQEHSGEASTSTRSVLDALKEISRKRIHASEEYDINNDSKKRQKTDFFNGLDTNKRTRDETSPLLDSPTSPSKPVSKKACMYDEYAASCSSTVYAINNSDFVRSKRKSISTSTLIENPKETKQVKLINAETQTAAEIEDKIPKNDEKSEETPQQSGEENGEQPMENKRESPLRVFDDAPLERIRKNRLAALMGSLTGKDPVLAPKPTFFSILNGNTDQYDSHNTQTSPNELDKTEKPLVSILTTNKLPNKTDKHVHFNIPESSSSTSSNENKDLCSTNSTMDKNIMTPVSISQPLSSNNELSVRAPPSSPVSLKEPESNEKPESRNASLVSLSSAQEINLQATSSSSAIITFAALSASNSSTIPQFSFSTSTANSSTSTFDPSMKSPSLNAPLLLSPPKMGGFKFDLSNSKTTTTVANNISGSSQPTGTMISFGKSSSNQQHSTNSVDSTAIATISTTTSTGLTFGTTTTASSTGPLSSSSESPFKFGVFSSDSQTKPKSTVNEAKNTVAGSTFAFGTIMTTTNASSSAITTSIVTTQGSKTPNFSFNAPKMTLSHPAALSTFSFGDSKQTTIASTSLPTTSISFGTVSENSSISSNLKGLNNFGSATSTSEFGTSTPAFGSSNTNSFEKSVTQNSTKVTSSSFGTPTTAINTFGTNSSAVSTISSNFEVPASGFGLNTSTAPSFAAANNSTGFGGFGTASKPSEGFGTTDVSKGGFSTTASIFGGNKPATSFTSPAVTTSSSFGTAAAATGSLFNNTGLPDFGQKAPLSFGTATTTASFGSNTFNNATTTSSSVFGGSSGFGTLNNSTHNNIFGGTSTIQTPGFQTSTTQAPGFGTSTIQTPGFGTSTTQPPSFGTSTTQPPSFGTSTTQPPSFGTSTTQPPSFGTSTTQPPSFGTSTTQPPSFGTSTTQTPSFGTSNTIFATTSTAIPFGNKITTTSNSTAIFSFGAKTTTASGNGFGSNPTSTGGFGSSAISSFGTNNVFGGNTNSFGSANAFGSTNTPSFGTTTSQPSGFATQSSSFGASSNQGFGLENKPIANQGFGIENKPLFGNTTTSSFGTNSAVSVFGSNSLTTFAGNANTSTFGKNQESAFGTAASNNFDSATGGFGSNQTHNPFGNSITPANNSASLFNFGSAASSKPAVFSFGNPPSSGELPKPTFNFTGGSGTPAFGSGSSFGSSTSSFGNSGPPQFGAPPPAAAAPNMFNIGSGSPSTRNRTMIRAKRRT